MRIRHRPRPKLSGRGRLLACAAILTAATWPQTAPAQAAPARLDALGPPVSDAELAEIRGKFIKPESVSFFGISMVTSWQDEFGITTVARLVFNVDFLARAEGGDPVPQLMIGWVREGDPALDVAGSHSGYTALAVSPQALPVGGLGTTSGAAQANIIAGADNSARNGLQIALVPTSSLQGFDAQGLSPITGTTALGFADGDQLEFRLGANELGLVMTGNNGSDSAIQSVGGDFGRMLQQTVLASDGNAVLNNSAIIIGADFSAAGFDAVRATEALSAMKGHGF